MARKKRRQPHTNQIIYIHYPGERLIRMSALPSIVGLGRSTVYRQIKLKRFPAPISLLGGRVAWRQSDIDAWIAERVA